MRPQQYKHFTCICLLFWIDAGGFSTISSIMFRENKTNIFSVCFSQLNKPELVLLHSCFLLSEKWNSFHINIYIYFFTFRLLFLRRNNLYIFQTEFICLSRFTTAQVTPKMKTWIFSSKPILSTFTHTYRAFGTAVVNGADVNAFCVCVIWLETIPQILK